MKEEKIPIPGIGRQPKVEMTVQERIDRRISEKDRQISVSASFNRATQLIAAQVKGELTESWLESKVLSEEVAKLGKAIYKEEQKFLDELEALDRIEANKAVAKVERKEKTFEVRDEVED